MIINRDKSPTAEKHDEALANAVSRRSFLQTGAAAGGGLMLSLRLPFAKGEAEAAGADTFAPNAFVRIESDGQIVLTMPSGLHAQHLRTQRAVAPA